MSALTSQTGALTEILALICLLWHVCGIFITNQSFPYTHGFVLSFAKLRKLPRLFLIKGMG
jgi:hypothetical protein